MKKLFKIIILLLTLAVIPVISKPAFAAGTGRFTFFNTTPSIVKTGATQFMDVDVYFTPTSNTPVFAIIAKLDFTEDSGNPVSYVSFTKDSDVTRSDISVIESGNGKVDSDSGGSIFLQIASSNQINGSVGAQVKLGKLRFRVVNTGSFTLGIDSDANNTYVLDANNIKYSPLDTTATGTYTITAPTQAPGDITVTGLPGPGAVSPAPTCISTSLSAIQKAAAVVSWSSTSNGPFWVDISPSNSFTPFYHKSVTTKSTDLTGLNSSTAFPVQEVEIQPATTYYLRITDQSINQTSAAIQINIPACAVAPVVACSSFIPVGLTDTGQIGSRGEKIYATTDSTGGTKTFAAVWTPLTATFTPAATGLTFTPAVGSTTSWVSVIPDNPSTTAVVEYTVNGSATSASASASCTPFIVRVPKKVIDTACPTTTTSTQAKLSLNGSSWGTAKTITLGDPIRVAGFHSNSSTPMDQATADMVLTVTGPQGTNSSTLDINDLDATDITKHNDISFTPTAAGTYAVIATVKGKTGANCTGQATLTVVPVTVVTNSYRISDQPFDKTNTTIPWVNTTSPTITIPAFTFTNPVIGQNFNLYAQFKSNTGLVTDVFSKSIKYIGPDPVITNIACGFDSSTGTGSTVTLIGRNFGLQGTSGAVKVISASGNANGTVSSWGSFVPSATLLPAGNIGVGSTGNIGIGTTGNVGVGTTGSTSTVERVVATISDRLTGTANVELTLDDGRKITRSCVVNTNTVSFNTQTQCVLPGNFSASNVRVQIAEDVTGARPLFDSRTTPIALDAQGLPQWTAPALEVGKTYNLIIKTPKSLAVSQKFTVLPGTNVLQDILFPVGDIAPATAPDGVVNAFDTSELFRQWNISSDTAKTGDFNGDGRINSIDYSCMRRNNNISGAQFLR